MATTLRLLRVDTPDVVPRAKHRTGAVERTYIEGYPRKLFIYIFCSI